MSRLFLMALMQIAGFFIFAVFWMVSSPIYLAAGWCDWLDIRVNTLLNKLFSGWGLGVK